jgi:hypothetical protein
MMYTRDGYGVRAVYGVRCGYRGFYSDNLELLTPELVEHIHMQLSPLG